MAYKKMGELLTSAGVITEEQLQEAIRIQKKEKKRLGAILVSHGFITERQLLDALQMQLKVEFVDLAKDPPAPEMAQVLSKNIAKRFGVVPVRVVKDELYLAMSDPLNFFAIEAVKSATRKRVVPMLTTEDGAERAISALYGNEGAVRAIEDMNKEMGDDGQVVSSLSSWDNGEGEGAQSAPVIRLVNTIIERAVTERASDIHLEPRADQVVVRMRIDGLLRSILVVPKNLQGTVTSRLKVMGGMDISERKIPQDGRANVRVKNGDMDLRMSTIPTIHGEKIVIRLLDKSSQILTPKGLGLEGAELEKFKMLLSYKNGVVLLTGPTGSGKSSTMATMVRLLNKDEVNIITLEDPVEYHVEGVNQVQINEKTGMLFANGLRSVLRQDPDIIAVGEIRDGETAGIAMRAAITGHLVLSTIHTNDALSAVERLKDIGVEPYLIAGALRGLISQRLVRKICPHCKKQYQPSVEELKLLRITPEEAETTSFYKGEGCPMCYGTGYHGRQGVFEIISLGSSMRRLISEGAGYDRLLEELNKTGFASLFDNCRTLVLTGVTSVEEAERTILSTEE